MELHLYSSCQQMVLPTARAHLEGWAEPLPRPYFPHWAGNNNHMDLASRNLCLLDLSLLHPNSQSLSGFHNLTPGLSIFSIFILTHFKTSIDMCKIEIAMPPDSILLQYLQDPVCMSCLLHIWCVLKARKYIFILIVWLRSSCSELQALGNFFPLNCCFSAPI